MESAATAQGRARCPYGHATTTKKTGKAVTELARTTTFTVSSVDLSCSRTSDNREACRQDLIQGNAVEATVVHDAGLLHRRRGEDRGGVELGEISFIELDGYRSRIIERVSHVRRPADR